ncbi:MAG: (Fe-S)-binding protein [Nocardioidaceae bacterium]
MIDPDVLWSCTSCGACVQQCPVDIEHVDHIMDMRRFQVLVESNFPAELNQLFKGLENKGNPWNMLPNARMDWAKDLPFEVKQVGADIESLDEVEWLFWVGCAGAYEDRAKKTTRAVAELLHEAGVSFAVLGSGETCTGDPARRSGNEFVFQQLAMQNAEVLTDARARKVVATCAHCFNTLKNEYSAARCRAGGRPPHPAAQPPGPRRSAGPDRARGAETHHHLSRSVLHRPPQSGLRASPRTAVGHSGR